MHFQYYLGEQWRLNFYHKIFWKSPTIEYILLYACLLALWSSCLFNLIIGVIFLFPDLMQQWLWWWCNWVSDGVWYQLINDISHDETAAVISDNIVLLLMITFLHSQCPLIRFIVTCVESRAEWERARYRLRLWWSLVSGSVSVCQLTVSEPLLMCQSSVPLHGYNQLWRIRTVLLIWSHLVMTEWYQGHHAITRYLIPSQW